MKVYIEKFKEKFIEILYQILNDEDKGKKMFMDSEELGKSIGNREKYYYWVEEQRALPEEKPSDWFAAQKKFMSKKRNVCLMRNVKNWFNV